MRHHLFMNTRAVQWLVLLAAAVASGCGPNATASAADANLGRHLIYSYGCGSCHVIPGVAEAVGTVGPSLKGLANRDYIAGVLTNTPDNLSRWIADPQALEPGNAMPRLGVTPEQARRIAAYLYTLK